MICFKPKSDYTKLDFMLYHCGTGECEKNSSWGPGVRDYYSLYYVYEGKGYLIIDGQEYEIKEGTCFLVPPHSLVSYRPNPSNPWGYYFVSFNGLHVDSYLGRINLSPCSPISKCDRHEAIERCFELILTAGQFKHSMDLQALSGFYALLATLAEYSHSHQTKIQTMSKQSDYIRQAIEFIETNYARHITVEEISNYVGINRKYLTKLFNELMADSPKNYLIHFRIHKACNLLRKTNLTIQEISHSVGYTDALVFSKIFKKVIGTCPREYRSSNFIA